MTKQKKTLDFTIPGGTSEASMAVTVLLKILSYWNILSLSPGVKPEVLSYSTLEEGVSDHYKIHNSIITKDTNGLPAPQVLEHGLMVRLVLRNSASTANDKNNNHIINNNKSNNTTTIATTAATTTTTTSTTKATRTATRTATATTTTATAVWSRVARVLLTYWANFS